MSLTKELINVLRTNNGNNITSINKILNDYNATRNSFDKLTGEDLINAYKIAVVDKL